MPPSPISRLLTSLRQRRGLRALYRTHWKQLAPELRTPQQLTGIAGIACGATHGVEERCNFACSSCYLTDLANRTRALPFRDVKTQLDQLRSHLGHGGKAQITSGEVTLLPVAELGRIVAYAKHIGLDPMVMTNGQRFLQDPAYLTTLVRDHGLRKVSFHVDTTQNGRPGLRDGMREAGLDPVRDQCAALIRQVRAETGLPLHAAQTITVTPSNLADVPDILRWTLEHTSSIRLLSLQPLSEVGRTLDRRDGELSMDRVWEQVCRAVGRPLNRHAMHFGHPDCNISVPLLVLSSGNRREVIEAVRANHAWDLRMFSSLLRAFGPRIDLDDGLWLNGLRALPALLLHPWLLFEVPAYAGYRLWGMRRRLAALLSPRLRIHPLLLVVHKFMDEAELQTPLGRERLAACVFKLAVEGSMVSMCEMNATALRRQQNERNLRTPLKLGTAAR